LDKADGVGRPLRRKVIATSRPKIHADIASFTLRFGVSRKPQRWSNSGRTRAPSGCPVCATSGHGALPTNIPQAASAGGVSTRRVVASWVHGKCLPPLPMWLHLAAFFFGSLPFLGVKVPQQLYWADDSTLLQGPLKIWTPPKECGCWPVAAPRAAHLPRLCAEGSDARGANGYRY
jgi:hypothetical protein